MGFFIFITYSLYKWKFKSRSFYFEWHPCTRSVFCARAMDGVRAPIHMWQTARARMLLHRGSSRTPYICNSRLWKDNSCGDYSNNNLLWRRPSESPPGFEFQLKFEKKIEAKVWPSTCTCQGAEIDIGTDPSISSTA